jgi:hypothetical protein
MTARDIQIKNYEGWFQRAAGLILARAGIGAAFLAQEAQRSKLPASRIDVLFIKGPAAEISTNDQGDEIEDDHSARLIFTLSTKREQAQIAPLDGVKNLHEHWAATLRAAFEFKADPFRGLLPFYTVTHLREGQNDRDLDLNFWLDYTRLPLDLRFSIHGNAWSLPASALELPAP